MCKRCLTSESPGGPDIALRHPNIRTLVNTIGDGNCIFRNAIVTHKQLNSDLFMSSGYVGINVNHNSVDEYINDTQIDTNGAWGTAIGIFALAHLLNTRIISSPRVKFNRTWQLHSPSHVDPSLQVYESDSDCAIYVFVPHW